GKRLFGNLRNVAAQHGATFLNGIVPEDDPVAVQFATSLGFSIRRHEFESSIDLGTWQEAAVADKLLEVEAQGVRLSTYADEPCEAALYELAKRNSVDLPGYDASTEYPPIDEWRKRWLEDPASPLDCIIVAAMGETLVGVTRMGKYNEAGD